MLCCLRKTAVPPVACLIFVVCALADANEPSSVPDKLSFVNDVLPVITKAGCNQGACHGGAAGKGGFKLSLRGVHPKADFEAIVRDRVGRRINRVDSAQSLLLLKPLMKVSHRGGQILSLDSEQYAILRSWIDQGLQGPNEADPTVAHLLMKTETDGIELEAGKTIALRVEAVFSDDSRRDVTRWARFDTNDARVAKAENQGRVTAVGSGKAAISAIYQGRFAATEVVVPYPQIDSDSVPDFEPRNEIDQLVSQQWAKLRLRPSALADDVTFLRRVFLDVTGTLPSPERVQQFVDDLRHAKRDVLIDELLQSPEFVDMWLTRFGDVLRLSSEWLGGEGIGPFNDYLRKSITKNVPYDELVQQLIAGSGDAANEGPPNYVRLYRAGGTQNWHLNISETVAQTFLGVRLQCARCHDHPKDRWSQEDYYGFASFFSRVRSTRPPGKNDGPESVISDYGLHEVPHPRKGIIPPVALDGTAFPATPSRCIAFEPAQWLWDTADAMKDAEANAPRYFRRTYIFGDKPIAAQIHATVDDVMTLHVNGTQVATNANWQDHVGIDISGLLTAGKNTIAIEAVNKSGPGGMIAWMQIVRPDRGTDIFGTDASWKVSKAKADDWTAVEFDDSAWQSAVQQGPANSEPWKIVPYPAQPIGPEYQTRRDFVAKWVTARENTLFARMTVNRVWRHFMGRGLVEPVDDFRLSNPPTNAALLETLAADLVEHGYDMRHLMRRILQSNVYQLSSDTIPANEHDTMFYSHYYARRMTAEQILDGICQVTGIPEEFPGQAKGTRAQQLPDTRVASPFLDAFGRPLRRSASCECERVQDPNLGQSLELLNGPAVHSRVVSDAGLVNRLLTEHKSPGDVLNTIYLKTVARRPSNAEQQAILAAVPNTTDAARRTFFEDVLWAVLNGKEFLFNH